MEAVDLQPHVKKNVARMHRGDHCFPHEQSQSVLSSVVRAVVDLVKIVTGLSQSSCRNCPCTRQSVSASRANNLMRRAVLRIHCDLRTLIDCDGGSDSTSFFVPPPPVLSAQNHALRSIL